jgi:tetratricopeptide (TPR) repeat protein
MPLIGLINNSRLIINDWNPSFWVSAVLFVMMTVNANFSTAAPIAWEHIVDPHVRAAQYDGMLGEPFAAITQLLADVKKGRVQQRSGQVQLVLGGLHLDYGSHYKAAEIFKTLAQSDQSQEIRNLAWYNLARVQYQRSQGREALKSLQRINGELPDEAQQERLLLASMLLMEQNLFEEAVVTLKQLGETSLVQRMSEKSVWATYGRFNLGVALFQQGKEQEGRRLLEELGTMSVEDEESSSLRDKANLTLAFDYLSKQEPEKAQQYLIKTRLQGPMSNKALLGLGRVYSAKEQHKKSLVPWLRLIKQNSSDPSVQDALLAVPFAFGKLTAYKQALEYYKSALTAYKKELEQVNKATETVNSGVLVDSLVRTIGTQSNDQRWFVSKLPATPGGRYLWQLFATHEFQETLKNYSRVRLSLGRLEQWSSEVDEDRNLTSKQKRAMLKRISRLQSRLISLVNKLRGHLKESSLKELENRKQRLVSYAADTRFSMAQLYDYAAKRWGNSK